MSDTAVAVIGPVCVGALVAVAGIDIAWRLARGRDRRGVLLVAGALALLCAGPGSVAVAVFAVIQLDVRIEDTTIALLAAAAWIAEGFAAALWATSSTSFAPPGPEDAAQTGSEG